MKRPKIERTRIVPEHLYERALRMGSQDGSNLGEIFTLLEKSHLQGDFRATYALGTWYFHGTHVRKNQRKGISYFRSAAKGGIADALFDLAMSYEIGSGVRKDLRVAYEYYLRAALAGDPQAQYEVGRCLYYGIGSTVDRRLARIWLDHAKLKGGQAQPA